MRTTTSTHAPTRGRTPGELLDDVIAAVEATGVEVLEATSHPLPHDDAKHFVSVTWSDDRPAFDHAALVAVTEAVLA